MTFQYEQLNHMTFQQLVQAVLADAFPGTIAYPIGQADGGRDASQSGLIEEPLRLPAGSDALDPAAARAARTIYQVKFATRPERINDPVKWLQDAFKSETDTLDRLHDKGKGNAKRYFLITNLQGSASAGSGQMDRLDAALADLNSRFPRLAIEVWWRDTLDRHLESAFGLWWSYPQILDGPRSLALVLQALDGDQANRRDRALRVFMADQARSSRYLRFNLDPPVEFCPGRCA